MHTKQQSGFTLVELAIVLVIITSLLTLGLGALTSLLATGAYSETKAKQARIKDALIAYLGSNKRLPCPDIPNNTNGAANDGSGVTGNEDKDTVTGVCIDTFGVVPFTALGLSPDVATDGWGGFFSYQVYVDNPLPTCPGTGRNWTNAQCFGAGKTGSITIKDVDGTSDITTNAVVVLVSHGPNGFRAWLRQGTRNVDPINDPKNCPEASNSRFLTFGSCAVTPTSNFYKGERPENDDVVAYLTADDIIQSLSKQGAILSAPAQVYDDLRTLVDQKMAEKTSASVGCALPVSTTVLPDPWGNAYTITNGPPPQSYFPITICSGTTCRIIERVPFNMATNLSCPG